MVEQRERIRRGKDGRYLGYRVNCEQVPMLPAWIVRRFWVDPRRVPYLLAWKGTRGGKVKQAVRLARVVPGLSVNEASWVEVKRADGSSVHIQVVWRSQPHNGNQLLLRCSRCLQPNRALYGVKVGDDGHFYLVRRADWECRGCAKLRYSSEGGALIVRSRFKELRPLSGRFSGPRPRQWLPLVFSSPIEAARAGVCVLA
jgi:hypothetical protein